MPARVERTGEAVVDRHDLWRAPAGLSILLAVAPTGIVDWGDRCRADPALDLAMVWSTFPPEGREAFLDEYGPVEEDQLIRARLLGVFLAAVLLLHVRAEGMAALEREALTSLDRAARA